MADMAPLKHEHMASLPVMGRIRRMHFVGIGGAGMGGIAELVHNLGYHVTGSDSSVNSMVQRLSGLGIAIHQGHDAAYAKDSDVIIVSTAVSANNPELVYAHEQHIPVVPRAEMLAELMRFRYGIAVAGTHGKTSTTSLIASLLGKAGLDPTFVIGGKLNSIGANAQLGGGRYLVAEADESDASFLHLQPMMAVLTNIDHDHMSTYENDFSRLRDTFLEFLHHLPFYGLAVVCIDDPVINEIIENIQRPILTYGFSEQAQIRASDLRQEGNVTYFNVALPSHSGLLDIQLNMAGRHNVQNALGAIAVAYELGVSLEAMQEALSTFEGVSRRMQQYGQMHVGDRKVLLIDDYAHHPTELRASIDAVKQGWPKKRLVLVFQPHRYSRTRDLFDEFVRVLADVDVLLLLEVYAAGEAPVSGADSTDICRSIRARGGVDPLLVKDMDELVATLNNVLLDDDLLLTLGAGDIGRMASELPMRLEACSA